MRMSSLVGFTEMIGGLLLLVGLLARVASVPLGITMIAAIFIAHREEAAQGIPEFVRESPLYRNLCCVAREVHLRERSLGLASVRGLDWPSDGVATVFRAVEPAGVAWRS